MSEETPPELLPAPQEQTESSPSTKRNRASVQVTAYHHSGPLPDPRELQAYENTIPGAAERILILAEKQAQHRMELERAVVFGGITQMRAGLACATVVVLSTLGVTAYTASLGQGLWGLAAVFAEIGAISGAFIYSAKKNSEERTKKDKQRRKPDEKPAMDKEEPQGRV